MKGVKKGTISKRDFMRAWVIKQGGEPFEFSEAKAAYDSVSGADPRFTAPEVYRILSEGCSKVDRGTWRQDPAPSPGAGREHDHPFSSGRDDLMSWEHPLLLETIATWNASNCQLPGDEDWVEVNFSNEAWMSIYRNSFAQLPSGCTPGPLDCVLEMVSELISSKLP